MRAPSVCGPDNAYFTGSVTKMQEDQKKLHKCFYQRQNCIVEICIE